MPIGGGILPASGSTQYTELTYVTRRAFIPKLVVQIYNSTPLLAALIANAQSANGGVSSVTVPVQGAQFVNAQWSDYSGSFAQPSVQQGAYNAEFNLKLMISPVPFLGMEGAVQNDAAIIPLVEARMNDATNVMMDAMATALYTNTSNTQQFIGLPVAVDDGYWRIELRWHHSFFDNEPVVALQGVRGWLGQPDSSEHPAVHLRYGEERRGSSVLRGLRIWHLDVAGSGLRWPRAIRHHTWERV